MSDPSHRRSGLEPVPGRVPPLPGVPRGSATPAVPRDTNVERRSARPAYRALEFQADAEIRRYLETTTFAIRLRTDGAFDRSALIRGILRAVLRSGVDLAGCDTEDEVTAMLARNLPAGAP